MLKGLKTSIRPIEEDDIDVLYSWYNDEEVNLWSSGAWPLNTPPEQRSTCGKVS